MPPIAPRHALHDLQRDSLTLSSQPFLAQRVSHVQPSKDPEALAEPRDGGLEDGPGLLCSRWFWGAGLVSLGFWCALAFVVLKP